MKKKKFFAIVSIILCILFFQVSCYKEVKANPAILVLTGLEGVTSLLGVLGLSLVLDLNSNTSNGIADKIGTCETCQEIFYYSGNGSTVKKELFDFNKHITNCNNNNNGNKKIPASEAIYGKHLWDVMTDEQKESYEKSIRNGSSLSLNLSLGQLDQFRNNVNSTVGLGISTSVPFFDSVLESYNKFKNITVSSFVSFSVFEKTLQDNNCSYVILRTVLSNSLEGYTMYFTAPNETINYDSKNFIFLNKFSGFSFFKEPSLSTYSVGGNQNYNNSSYFHYAPGALSFSYHYVTGYNLSSCTLVKYYISGVPSIDNQTKEIEIVNPNIELMPGTGPVTFTVPAEKVQELVNPMYDPDSNTFKDPVEKLEDLQDTVNPQEPSDPNDINDTNVPERANLDFSPLYADLSKKFPFCIPFDLFNLIDSLSAEAERPSFRVTFPSVYGSKEATFEFNFDDYYLVIQIFRYFILLGFVIGLIINTKKILGGS